MKTIVYICEHENPWFNLATEDYLFQNAPDNTQVLFLWRNAPSVIIGRAQNPWLECQVEQMEKDEVMLARRQSGGGTVYHDLGNTNFTFISPKDQYSKDNNFNIIIEALAKFGVSAIRSGRNDILVDDKKISGSAFRENKYRAFHHGTLLINADLERLTRYLSPNRKKLEAKGVKSVRSRVMNVTEYAPKLTHKLLCDAIIDSFFSLYKVNSLDPAPAFARRTLREDDTNTKNASNHSEIMTKPDITVLDLKSLKKIPALNEKYTEYQSWEWRFGRTLPFTHQLEHKFEWGLITLQLIVTRGKITDCELFTDSLTPEDLNPLKLALIGCDYLPSAIKAKCTDLNLDEITNWISNEIR